MRRRLTITFALLALAVSAPAAADDDYRVSARVEPASGASDTRPVELVIEVKGNRMPDVSVPKFPALVNLRVVSGPATSRSTSFSLGSSGMQQSASASLVYSLLPMAPGPAEVPALTIRVGDKIYKTEPIRFEVSAGPTGPIARGREQGPDRGAGEEPEVFLRARLSAPEVWVGQPVFLDVTLYAARPVTNFAFDGLPSLSSFWTEEIAVDPNQERRSVTIEGRDYVAYPVLRRALIPATAGDLTIEPFVARLEVRQPGRDLFGEFFGMGRTTPIVRKSSPLRLRVKALPEQGRPDDFGGAVGSFRLTVETDRSEARVDDAVAFAVTIEGTGSLQGVPPPKIESSPDLKVFDPKAEESSRVRGDRIESRKHWEWVFVPLAPGSVSVPPVRFSFFDPATGAYRTLSGPATALTVRRGGAPETTVAGGEVRALRRDIAFIKEGGGSLARKARGLHRSKAVLVLVVLPLVGAPIVVAAGRRRARLLGDRGRLRSRRAGSRARRLLRQAERALRSHDVAAFHETTGRALVGYVADRFDRSPAGLSYDVAEELLSRCGADVELSKRFRACLETCDFARFVPGSATPERLEELLRDARALVEALEGCA